MLALIPGGFAVAIGILLDTIIVRPVLVTALTLDIGRWMWWPSKLARRDGGQHHLRADREDALTELGPPRPDGRPAGLPAR